MANITINEVSQNYTYNIGNASYATVALPITASWGPGFTDSADGTAQGIVIEEEKLERISWTKFTANQAGLESFISTFRGPSTHYLQHKDFSYQQAMSLLTSGYDVLVCRVSTGLQASGKIEFKESAGANTFTLPIKAKYVGSFGNKIRVALKKIERKVGVEDYSYWNMIVYIEDTSGVRTAVENTNFVFDIEKSTDTILHVTEVESAFIDLLASSKSGTPTNDTVILKPDTAGNTYDSVNGIILAPLSKGTDLPAVAEEDAGKIIDSSIAFAKDRFSMSIASTLYANAKSGDKSTIDALEYIVTLGTLKTTVGVDRAKVIMFREWMFNAAYTVLGTLDDKLAYNPNRIIVPGWDDQDICFLLDDDETKHSIKTISPLHSRLMHVAYYSRCATAYLDIPRSIKRGEIYNDATDENSGYAQKLARLEYTNIDLNTAGSFYASHSALFAPWGKFTYAGMPKQAIASPSFLALLIDRAMIKNQTSQYEWLLPTSRRHSLKIGKLDYAITKKYLDLWQSNEGVGVNCITTIPEIGVSIWGNSTLYEVPPATYQALSNLSTRKLVNAVEDLAYRCGISITFQYNNDEAYNAFYAGCTPLLDTMKNQHAIDDYYIRMASDINGLDSVAANTVIGKIYLVVPGVVNDIDIDLIALPPTASLDDYRA